MTRWSQGLWKFNFPLFIDCSQLLPLSLVAISQLNILQLVLVHPIAAKL